MTTTAPGPGTGRSSSGQLVRWSAGTALISLGVLVLVLLAGGGAPQPVPAGLPDPGPVTGWGLPVVRLVTDLAGMASVGLMLAAALLLPSPAARLSAAAANATRLAARTARVWAAGVVVEVVLTLSDLLGLPPASALDPSLLRSFLGQTAQGRGLLLQFALALSVAGLARSVTTTRGATFGAFVAACALVPPALTGHSASSGSHELATASLSIHVLAAALWVGGLAALAWAAFTERDDLRFAIRRFSTLAAWCFVTVAVSGAVNAAVRLESVPRLVTTSYGVLVLGKLGALVVLGAFGWWHRRHTVDRVAGGAGGWAFISVAAVELAIMAATVALAVGLSRTPTPSGGEVDGSPAAQLLGFPLPPAPTISRVAFGWVPDGFALVFLVFAAALYGAGVLALRRRGDSWPVGRSISWAAGLAVFAWATVGGLGLYSHVLFSAHMVAHMMLSMVAPIGLVLGAPITLALRALPGPRTPGELGPRQLLQGALRSRAVQLVTHPLVALALFVGSLYALYFTPLFPWLMRHHVGHVAMEFHFLAIGFLFFWVLVGIDPEPRRLPPIARVGLLFAAMPFHAFFSIALMSASTVVARDYFSALDRPYAIDLLSDQSLGGSIGWAMGELPILLVLGAVFVQWTRSDRREADRFDRAADRAASTGAPAEAGTDAMTDYNTYLARLAARDARRDERHEGTNR
jgi:cytochrome c oxidase assembly factor CtaG/putative copper export protein